MVTESAEKTNEQHVDSAEKQKPNAIYIKPRIGSVAEKSEWLRNVMPDRKRDFSALWHGGTKNSPTGTPYWSIPINMEAPYKEMAEKAGSLGDLVFEPFFDPERMKSPALKKLERLGKSATEALEKARQYPIIEEEKEQRRLATLIEDGLLTEADATKEFEESKERISKEQARLDREAQMAIDAEGASLEAAIKNPFPTERLANAINRNEVGDAELFLDRFGKDYLFNPNDGEFYFWEGSFWRIDLERSRNINLRLIADEYEKEGRRVSGCKESGEKSSKPFFDRARVLRSRMRQGAVLDMARPGVYGENGLTFLGQWDDCAGFLPCSNGLVDLENGDLLKPQRSMFVRKRSSLAYDPNASCPGFEKFILNIMSEDSEMAAFLKRLVGYAAIGKPTEHVFVFFYGQHGRNGKGVLSRIIQHVLANLAREFPAEMLLLQKNATSSFSARPDLIHLQGTRFATFSEINKGRSVDAAILKNLSGGDTIAARALYSNDLKNFPPTHTLFFSANHKPQAPSDDKALWKRAILVPFDREFCESPDPSNQTQLLIDPHLEARLKSEESAGILRWMVEGSMEYHRSGLQVPQRVQDAVANYQRENDGVRIFIEEHCTQAPELSAIKSKFTESVQEFCKTGGMRIPNRREVNDQMRALGFRDRHSREGDLWSGISITPDCDQS